MESRINGEDEAGAPVSPAGLLVILLVVMFSTLECRDSIASRAVFSVACLNLPRRPLTVRSDRLECGPTIDVGGERKESILPEIKLSLSRISESNTRTWRSTLQKG